MVRFEKYPLLLVPIGLACALTACSDVPAMPGDTDSSSGTSSGSSGDTTGPTTGDLTTGDPTTGGTTTTTTGVPTTTDTTVTGTSSETGDSSSSTGGPVCGNDIREDGEECDEGELNAADWNCMADCTINPVQRLILDQDEAAIAAGAHRSTEHSVVGDGSWCNSPGEDLNGDGVDKFEMYWDPEEEVPLRDDDDPHFYNWGPTMLADIADAQYNTRRPAEQAGLDFFMLVYTRKDGQDDKGSFYGYRLTGVPWRAERLDHNVDTWDTFRLAAPQGDEPNTATFYDTAFTDEFDGQPTAADIVGTMAFDWTAFNPAATPSAIDYGAEMVRFLSLQTASNWNTFEGCVDGITVWHTDGRQLIIDLE